MYGLGGQRSDETRPQGIVLLPTPKATNNENRQSLDRFGMNLGQALGVTPLLPTPSVADAMGGHLSRSGARSSELLLPGVVKTFLPTPTAGNFNDGESPESWTARRERLKATAKNGNGMGTQLGIAVQIDWGQYAPAIARHERFTGRPAPAPTATSPKGGQRLSPAFVEWMMGLPAGWVTDAPGLTRSEALKALGNGVVPQQAAHALRVCLGRMEAIA